MNASPSSSTRTFVVTGTVVSCTVILNDVEPVLPDKSVAVQLTVVIPNGNVEPDGRMHIGVMGPSTSSFAFTVKTTKAPAAEVASAIISTCGSIVGGIVSTTIKVALQLAVLPALSVVVNVIVVLPR